MPSRTVLITGCSTGIGHATAARLAAGGWTVYASARRPETLADLEARGCRVLALDVTSEESMQAAVAAVEGGVGVLINNAGYSQSGALETLPMDSVRRQFETNVFGLLRLTQLVLPGMRAAGAGKIVNVSSMGGRLTFPGGGAYHATKYAVEAMSDALRMEVRHFGIDVICIEPGLIRTEFGETAAGGVTSSADDPYADFNRAVAKSTRDVYDGPLSRLGRRRRLRRPRDRAGARQVARADARAGDRLRPRHDGPAPRAARPRLGPRRRRRLPQLMAFDLARFVTAQDPIYDRVVSELRAGRKTSHWMWFVFPQIAGLGSSPTSVKFALSGLDEARAYLAHPVLGARLRECTQILADRSGLSAFDIFGGIDALKLHSSMTLFAHAAPDDPLFRTILDRYFDAQADPQTLKRI